MKGCVYKTVVRPAQLYGVDTRATTRGQEARCEDAEMDVRNDKEGYDPK